jgi:hypothetical protein
MFETDIGRRTGAVERRSWNLAWQLQEAAVTGKPHKDNPMKLFEIESDPPEKRQNILKGLQVVFLLARLRDLALPFTVQRDLESCVCRR